MAERRTRFHDEEERVKKTYEEIDTLLVVMNGREACGSSDEEENVEQLAELLMRLTGTCADASHDPDVATIGRMAALRWLRAIGYVTR